jgi:hypothetical protein
MTTDDIFNFIDLCMSVARSSETKEPLQPPQPIHCAVQSTEYDFVDLDVPEGIDSFAALPDYMSRRPYEKSQWVRRSSDNRCAPLIYVLAYVKHGTFSPALKPFWTDGDCTNTTPNNVSLMQAGQVHSGTPRNKYGVRSTSPEYRKRYYSDPANKQRNAENQRKTQARKRALLSAAKTVVDNNPDLAARIDKLKDKLGVD